MPRTPISSIITTLAADVGDLHHLVEALSGLAERAERSSAADTTELTGSLQEAEAVAREVAQRLAGARGVVELVGV